MSRNKLYRIVRKADLNSAKARPLGAFERLVTDAQWEKTPALDSQNPEEPTQPRGDSPMIARRKEVT